MAVTDVLLTLGVDGVPGAARHGTARVGGRRRGLAASAKYPGACSSCRSSSRATAAGAERRSRSGSRVLAFALTSPFVLVHGGAAWDDVTRVNGSRTDGWLGFEDDPATPFAFSLRLWETVGPLVLVALVGLVVAAAPARRRDLVLLSFAAVYCLSLLPIEAHFDRYVLPLVPVACVLAGATRPLAVAALVACLVPLWWSIDDTAALTGRDRRLDAAAWIDRTVPRQDTIAADPSTLPLSGRHVIRLELPGPGRPFDARRNIAALRAHGARWLVVSGVGHRPRPRGVRRLPGRGAVLPLSRDADACLRRRGLRARTPVVARVPHLPLSDGGRAAPLAGVRPRGRVLPLGAVLLGVEIAASRVLAPTFGSSLYVWGALIGVVLTGLALGYAIGGAVADRWPSPYLLVSAIALGALLVLAIPLVDRVGARARRHVGPRGRGSTRSSRRWPCSGR
jgi:hypothetical protein